MSYVRGFAPWIAFGVLSQFGWQWGAAGAALLAIVMLWRDRRAGASWDTQVLAIGAIAFFSVLTPIALALPNSALSGYTGAMSTGWLALVAWVSIIIGIPFTTGIARQQAPAAIWDSPAFRHLNTVITAAWASAFTVSSAANALLGGRSAVAVAVVSVVSFVVPMVFTRVYVARVRDRHAASGDQGVSPEPVAQFA